MRHYFVVHLGLCSIVLLLVVLKYCFFCAFICACAFVYILLCAYRCMCVREHVCTCVRACVCVCVYVGGNGWVNRVYAVFVDEGTYLRTCK